MKTLEPIEAEYWNQYLATLRTDERPISPSVHAAHAGSPAVTNALLELYFEGKKTAGSSIVEDFISCGDPLPKVGDYWIYLDSIDRPRCILRTERVVLNKFNDVSAEIAVAEGEGDLSLAHWRSVHTKVYQPHLESWGVKSIADATVITEFFEIVFR